MTKIKDPQTERFCLAGLLRQPEMVADVSVFVKESDFVSKLNRTCYGIILQQFERNEDVSPISISQRISNAGVSFDELADSNLVEFLEGLKMNQVSSKASLQFFKDLKKTTVRREIHDIGANLMREMESCKDKTIEEIISIADQVYSTKLNIYENTPEKDFQNIYDNIEEVVEARGNNPIENFGLMGPFSRLNEIYGSLLRPGNMTMIGARSGEGKTSLGMFYLNEVIKNNNHIPVFHSDAGEMSEWELQIRSVCMLTDGEVPMYLLETGQWRKNARMTELVREVWKVIKHLKYHYQDISNLTPDEILSCVYRYYLAKVGRGKEFIWHHDYLKSFENYGLDHPEWQQMGYFIQKVKAFIKNKVPCPWWTSIQRNKAGITGNKSSSQLDDSENTFSIGDRIVWQMSHAFVLRNKTNDELANQPGLGNMILQHAGKKRFLGKDAEAAIKPVKMSDGTLKQNHIMLEGRAFTFKEVGDLLTLEPQFGQLAGLHQHAPTPSAPIRKTKDRSESEDSDLIA